MIFSKVINQTTIFAAISAYIYFVWFNYESGMCMEYKIPQYYITPSISGLLLSSASLFGVFISASKALGITTPLFKQLQNPKTYYWHPIITINTIILIVGILLLYTYPFSWSGALFFLIILALINLISWGIAFLFKLKQKKTIEQKVVESIVESKDEQFNLILLLSEKFTAKQVLFGLSLIVIPFITSLLGGGVAAGTKSYSCLTSEKNLAVLKKFDDLLICRRIDTTTSLFQDTLYVIKINDQSIYGFTEHKGIVRMPR